MAKYTKEEIKVFSNALEIIAGERIYYDFFPPDKNDCLAKSLEKSVRESERELEAVLERLK